MVWLCNEMQEHRPGCGEAYLDSCSGGHRVNVLEWQLEEEFIIQCDSVGRGIPGRGRMVGKGRELYKVMES